MPNIALILSGGASLGAYTGGAVTELLRAFEGNRHGSNVRVGVITGSSSGALTAALAARALIVNPSLLPWIERAWIDGMDASILLNPRPTKRSSILNAAALEEISRALITAEPASDDRPSPLLGDSLQLGITLSNLHGVRYELSYSFRNSPEQSFGTRLFDDWIGFGLSRGDGARASVWEEIRRAAVASASFPFAFPPRLLARDASDFPGAVLPAGSTEIDMWYTDGGLFDNEPIGLAKRLADRSPHSGGDWRYVLVDPFLRETAEAGGPPPTEPSSAVQVAGLLAGAFLGQGGSKDWIRANRTNERLEILHSLVDRLPEIAESLTDPEALELGRLVGELAERVCDHRVPDGSDGADPVLELLEEHIGRVETRYPEVLGRVETRAARSRLAKLIFLIEAAGGLDDKEPMPLYLVAPTGGLAGDFLGNFGGLFSREWREADFRAGRRDARRVIESALGDVISYEPEDEAAYQVPELDVSYDALSPAQRHMLENLIEARIGRQIAAIDAGPMASLLGFVWRPAVRRWATRRLIDFLREGVAS
ncbi:MAG: patatin-like phospholipase family protein [Gemmatimonadetes bacterium]|nr:patatin-like phospholipase family protein [Gemmatimonadota bacterium]